MIDIDVSDVADAIYGGDRIDALQVAAWFAQHGIAWPCLVGVCHAASSQDLGPDVPADMIMIDQVHHRFVYCFLTADTPPDLAAVDHGDWQRCPTAAALLGAIQRAIISLRARHLEDGPDYTRQEELDARSLAIRLQRDRQAGPGREALAQWLRISAHRNRKRMLALRRRCIEYCSLLSLDCDGGGPLDLAYARALEACQDLHVFRDFLDTFPAIVDTLLAARPAAVAPPPLIEQALGIMQAQLAEPIGLRDIAAELGVSASHLARCCKQHTGETIVHHLHRLRIARAQELLLRSDRGILDIALDCGFPSVEHFHRIFKRHCGCSPRRWRLDQR